MRTQGVVKALFENGLLPKVLSGSSVGSISATLPFLQCLMCCSGTCRHVPYPRWPLPPQGRHARCSSPAVHVASSFPLEALAISHTA